MRQLSIFSFAVLLGLSSSKNFGFSHKDPHLSVLAQNSVALTASSSDTPMWDSGERDELQGDQFLNSFYWDDNDDYHYYDKWGDSWYYNA